MKWKRLGPSGEYTHYVMGLEEEEKRRNTLICIKRGWGRNNSFYKKEKIGSSPYTKAISYKDSGFKKQIKELFIA